VSLPLQAHGSVEEAEAARESPPWSSMLSIVWNTSKRPLLWFFTAVSLLHGECRLHFTVKLPLGEVSCKSSACMAESGNWVVPNSRCKPLNMAPNGYCSPARMRHSLRLVTRYW